MMADSEGPSDPLSGEKKSVNAVEASNKVKVLPQESAAQVKTRRWIVSSFWLVVLLLGFPMWWKTTMIYRAPLPLQDMIDWSDGKVRRQLYIMIGAFHSSLLRSVAQHFHSGSLSMLLLYLYTKLNISYEQHSMLSTT